MCFVENACGKLLSPEPIHLLTKLKDGLGLYREGWAEGKFEHL